MSGIEFIRPNWPAPPMVKALTTTRAGGVSLSPYATLNLAEHVEDNPEHVAINRISLMSALNLPAVPLWLSQCHGTHIIASRDWVAGISADGSVSDEARTVCAVLTADCLPVLLCQRNGDKVAAIHAGWRGLAAGILEHTILEHDFLPSETLAWLGPAIGPSAFEVGQEVYSAFRHFPASAQAFTQVDESHYLANLYLLAKSQLQQLGLDQIYGGHFCTFTEIKRFYSYRRDRNTGRMATLIWID